MKPATRLAAIATLAVALAVSFTPSIAQPACAPLKQIASIKLTKADNGHWFVPVAVNGTATHFALSMNFAESSLGRALAVQLNLPTLKKPTVLYKTPSDYAHVASLALDRAGQFTNSDILIAGEGTGGTIASDILTHFDIDLDLANATLNLFDSNHCDGQEVYWKTDAAVAIPFTYDANRRIRFPMQLMGQTFQTSFNMETPFNAFNLTEAVQKLSFKKSAPETTQLADPINNMHLYQTSFPSLGLAGVTIQKPVYAIYEQVGDMLLPVDLQNAFPMIPLDRLYSRSGLPASNYLGLDTMAKLHIYIALKEQKLYISPAAPGQ